MTLKQIERIKSKIDKLKKELAKDKKMWGGQHHDGRGIRYLLTKEYLKLKDYKSGLKYLKWFDKYFPDDIGYPMFLFESAVILYKNEKLKEAEEKVHRTFYANTFLLDRFLEKETLQLPKSEGSNWELESLVDKFPYHKMEPELVEFANWVDSILNTKSFLDKANEFIDIKQKLITEPVGEKRTKLIKRLYTIQYGEF